MKSIDIEEDEYKIWFSIEIDKVISKLKIQFLDLELNGESENNKSTVKFYVNKYRCLWLTPDKPFLAAINIHPINKAPADKDVASFIFLLAKSSETELTTCLYGILFFKP